MDKPEIPKDLGFGTGTSSKEQKLINNNGSFNVNRIGQSFFESFHIYHYLINQTWRNFILLVLLFYTVANFIFAIFYCYYDMIIELLQRTVYLARDTIPM